MANRTTIESVCECQAKLGAELDERLQVLKGWAVARSGEQETSPAHSIDADRDRFQVAWLCANCGRNTLRSFSRAAVNSTDAGAESR